MQVDFLSMDSVCRELKCLSLEIDAGLVHIKADAFSAGSRSVLDAFAQEKIAQWLFGFELESE